MNRPGPRPKPNAVTIAPAVRRGPRVPVAAMNTATCRKQPRWSEQPDVHFFFLVPALEIGTPKCARPLKSAQSIKAATCRDEHRDVANYRDANRSEVFVLRPSNY